MAEIKVEIADRSFRLACDDGQESRVEALAESLKERVSAIREKNGAIGGTQAILLAALAVMDEYDEAKARWTSLTPEGQAAEWVAERLDRASELLESALKTAP